jgi:hypothetical protein
MLMQTGRQARTKTDFYVNQFVALTFKEQNWQFYCPIIYYIVVHYFSYLAAICMFDKHLSPLVNVNLMIASF